MKIYGYTVLLLAMIWILSGIHPVWGEEPDSQELKDRLVVLQARFEENKSAFELACKQTDIDMLNRSMDEIGKLAFEMKKICVQLNLRPDDHYQLPIEIRDSFDDDDGCWVAHDDKGNRFYHDLDAHGDYTKLKLILRSECVRCILPNSPNRR